MIQARENVARDRVDAIDGTKTRPMAGKFGQNGTSGLGLAPCQGPADLLTGPFRFPTPAEQGTRVALT